MTHIPITVPYAVDLANSSSWDVLDGEKHSHFAIFRFHYVLVKRQVDPGPFLGEVVAAHAATDGATIEKLTSLKSRQKVVNAQKTIYSSLVSNELIASVAAKLSGEIGFSKLIKVTPEIKSELTGKIKADFSKSFEIASTVEEESEITQQFKVLLAGSGTNKVFSVKAFGKSSYQLWLGFIDYLFVEYRRSLWGLRKKRRKQPRRDGRKPSNIIEVKLPLSQIDFWELLSDELFLVDASKYKLEVEDPAEMKVGPLTGVKTPYLSLDDVPSLYQISEVAFPIRWIELAGDVTEEELKSIELQEVEEEGTAWWFEHGVHVKSGAER